MRSGAVDVVAVDSVAALTPRVELEGQMGETQVGLQARLMSQALRKLAGNLNRAKTVCLFTNQIREKIGVSFGSPETQPGGRALKFYSSQRLDLRRIETLKEGTEAVGNRVKVKVVKNKVAAPFRLAEFDIEYGQGISTEGCLIDLGLENDIVQKSGSFFSYGETRLGQGRNNSKQFLSENPEIASEIEGKIFAALGIERPGRPVAVAGEPEAEAEAPRPRREAEAKAAARPRRRPRPSSRSARRRTMGAGAWSRRASAYELAVRALSHKERSAAELATWLARRDVAAADVETVIDRLTAIGELDDERFARLFAEDKLELAGWGSERVREALLARGIAPEHIEAALAERLRGGPDRAVRATCSSAAGARSTPRPRRPARSATWRAAATRTRSPTRRSAAAATRPPERSSAWRPGRALPCTAADFACGKEVVSLRSRARPKVARKHESLALTENLRTDPNNQPTKVFPAPRRTREARLLDRGGSRQSAACMRAIGRHAPGPPHRTIIARRVFPAAGSPSRQLTA